MELTTQHDGGFFSCCSVRLHYLIEYFNEYKGLPYSYVTKKYFLCNKTDPNEDLTFKYFKHYNQIPITIDYEEEIHFKEWYQYIVYNKLDMNRLLPFVEKYFTPSDIILDIQKYIEKKYALDYENICVLFFRGNDKATEIELPTIDNYIENARLILEERNPNIKFLIQSDETNFINQMKEEFPNNIIFEDEIRHMYKKNATVNNIADKEKNYIYSLYYYAITLIMSKCKYVICNSGNCSLWIMFYRQNTNNIVQFCAVENI
jgi:hypothetical protein